MTRLAVAVSALALVAHSAAGQDSTSRAIAPGVTLRRVVRPEGPWVIHALAVDLTNRDIAVQAERACDRLMGRERPSAISRRLNASGMEVLAAINAGFFDLEGGSGATVGNVVVEGEIAQASGATNGSAPRRRPVRSQLAIERDGRPVIARFTLAGRVRTPRGRWPIAALNEPPAPDAVTLYTEWSQRPPRVPAAMRALSVPLALESRSGDTLRYRVLVDGADTARTPGERGLIVGTGSAVAKVAALRAGDRVAAVATLTPGGTPRALVTGWPAIVRDGRSLMETLDSLEGASKGFATTRHPRSAVGISRGGDTLFLVAVDGRQAASVGMSLAELARTMVGLGAWNALNLDGGGSTALVVRDSVVSSPSDPTGERAVGDVLLVTRAAAAGPSRSLPARESVQSCVLAGARDPDR